ncbi:hypothetical protein MMC13_008375 [Lambiella insularis]|nr:hypothetical protein [Lambiella insularis]
MFKKKPNIKSLAPLRSSDRRRVTDQIISDYQLEVPQIEACKDSLEEQANISSATGRLRNALLPDGSLSAKFSTKVGPDLKVVSGTIYAGASDGDEQRVLWFKVDDKLYPTVYTLWRHPRIVPLIHTPDFVLRKMRGGADLMIPGLARGPPFPPRAKLDSIVAVASLENPSIPVVVGVCEIDVSAISQVQGAKGHAVRTIHWEGDEIWIWSHGGHTGRASPNRIEAWDNEDRAEKCTLVHEIAGMNLAKCKSDQPDLNTDSIGSSSEPDPNEHLGEENLLPHEQLPVKDIDKAFWDAFLFTMHHHRVTHPETARHGLDFPIPQSLLISKIIPFLPVHNADDVVALQIKKSSWKSSKKFIKSLEKEGLLKSKDRNGGETVVQDVDFDNLAITTFTPYKLPDKEPTGAVVGGAGIEKAFKAAHSTADDSVGQQLKRISLLKPKDRLAPILEPSSSSLHKLYLPAEVRDIVTSYIESENLISAANKRLVILNPVLANAVFDGQSSMDREVLAKGSVPRDALIERTVQGCMLYWAILRNDETTDDVKPKAGNPPTMKILLETRSGNKKVTKVSGVEAFHIDPQALAEELQKACASSTSVTQSQGSSPKSPVMEIMVQGPQKDIVIKALEKRGVHRTWIEILDKTKGKKK